MLGTGENLLDFCILVTALLALGWELGWPGPFGGSNAIKGESVADRRMIQGILQTHVVTAVRAGLTGFAAFALFLLFITFCKRCECFCAWGLSATAFSYFVLFRQSFYLGFASINKIIVISTQTNQIKYANGLL